MNSAPLAVRVLRVLARVAITYVICWHLAFVLVEVAIMTRPDVDFSLGALAREYSSDLPGLWPVLGGEEVALIQAAGALFTGMTLLVMFVRRLLRRRAEGSPSDRT